MWALEETNKNRSWVLGRLKLINQKLVLQMINQSLKFIQLMWGLKRLLMVIIRALLEQCSFSRTISIAY